MKKSYWVSLALALGLSGLVAGLEQARHHYFLAQRVHHAQSVSDPKGRLRPGYWLGRLMQRSEWALSDLRFRVRGARPAHPDVVVVGIDEASIEALGAWPWPRSFHARLIDRLSADPPRALLFDVLFLEPFTSDPAGDRALVATTAKHPWAVHSLFFVVGDQGIVGGKLPFPALAQASERLGSVNAFPDDDGVLRSAPLVLRLEDTGIPLLSVEGVSLYRSVPVDDLAAAAPLDLRGEMLIQYAGPESSFPYLSFADVIQGKVPPTAWAGKVVLVGSRATGTYDHYPTPFSSSMPGVEFHANVIDNLLSGRPLRYAGVRWTLGLILGAALLAGLFLSRLSPLRGAISVVGLTAVFGASTQWLFANRQLLVDAAGPLLALWLSYLAIVVYRFFSEEREKRLVKGFFSQQVSGELLEVLMNDPGVLKKPGERREMTAFFSDVAGFTSISERMEPEDLVKLLNEYLTAMTDVIFEHGGYLDKYMGDGIMAFWNGLLKQPDHADRACQCALRSMRALEALNEDLSRKGLMKLAARIGVNTGIMASGYMGSSQKKQYTIMGDNVNLASRLEGANKEYGSSIMISETTYEVVHDRFEVRFLDNLRVKGKAKPVKTYELLEEKGKLDKIWSEALPIYHEGIHSYVDRDFEKARGKFLEVLKIIPQDKASHLYLERAEFFAANPPPKEWDGVFEMKSK